MSSLHIKVPDGDTKNVPVWPAKNRNSFGYNACMIRGDEFYKKYGFKLKHSQGKADFRAWYYSAAEMKKAGFLLVMRGTRPLWGLPEVVEPVKPQPEPLEVPESVKAWALLGAKHPCPDFVLEAKRESGLTWNQFVHQIK